MKRFLAIAFWSGFAGMALEMALARLVAPFFGSSQPVWAMIISTVLIAGAFGYSLGGRLSMENDNPFRTAGRALFVAGGAVASLLLSAHFLLGLAVGVGKGVPAIAGLLALLGLGIVTASALVSFSAVMPLCVRACVGRVETTGKAAGRIWAAATVGSLVGTLFSVFVMLPEFGLRATLLFLAGGSLIWAVAVSFSRLGLLIGAVVLGCAGWSPLKAPMRHPLGSRVLLDASTALHARVVVRERRSGVRELLLDEGWSLQSATYPHGLSRRGSWTLFRAAPLLMQGGAPKRALVIGLAGGTTARDLLLQFPNIEIDGVEIDGELVDIAKAYMDLSPKVRVAVEDGRRFLSRTSERYDLIYIDAYRDLYIPEHLSTVEFFRTAAEHLMPGGVLAINMLTYREEDSLAKALAQTLTAVFPTVDTVRSDSAMNVLIFARCHPRGMTNPVRRAETLFRIPDPRAQDTVSRMQPYDPLPDLSVFTDDRVWTAGLTHRIAWRMLFGR